MHTIYNPDTHTVSGRVAYPEGLGLAPGLVFARLPDDWEDTDIEFATLVDGALVVDRLTQATTLATRRIKAEVSERIESLSWRIERAQERDRIGAEGETVGAVLAEREGVRRAGNRAEAEVATLPTVDEANAFTWEVLPSDYPTNPVVTRLTFMRRFTDAERARIRAARDSGQSQDLLDFWELLQLATSVNLNDTDIKQGVNMLETEGLIGAGRAAEVLTV